MLMIRPENLMIIVSLVFCFTFVMPVVNMLIFRAFGTISSLTMETQQERIVPFVFITLIYGVVCYLFYFKLPFSSNFNKLILIVSVLVLAATMATFFFKVSVHSLSMWGVMGVLIPLNKAIETPVLLWPTALTLVLTGVVMSARLLLHAHTLREVMWGGIIGFVVSFMSVIVLF